MNMCADFVIISVFLINLILLSSSRIASCIKLMAVQGVLVALTPFIIPHSVATGVVIASILNIFLKGMIFSVVVITGFARCEYPKRSGARRRVSFFVIAWRGLLCDVVLAGFPACLFKTRVFPFGRSGGLFNIFDRGLYPCKSYEGADTGHRLSHHGKRNLFFRRSPSW